MTRTGRPRAFDTGQAVARAKDLFWSRGYATTSIQDLVDEIGVQRGSLYAAFGDKRGLYLRAVESYARENRERLQAALASGPVLPVLRRILVEPAELTGAAAPGPGSRRGCLLGNTAVELLPDDVDAKALVEAGCQGFVDVVAVALARAQTDGEVTVTASPVAQAELLLILFQGAAVVGRARPDRDALAAGVDAALDALRAPVNPTDRPIRACR